MPVYVVYEVWTRARVIQAKNQQEAYSVGQPGLRDGLNLSNWHVVPVEGPLTSGMIDREFRETHLRILLDDLDKQSE